MMERFLWRIELLGDVRAVRGDTVVNRFESRRVMALLAYLALSTRRRPTREELVDRIWPDAPQEAGRNRLKQALASLRRQLEPPPLPSGSVLEADRFSVGFRMDSIITDVMEFEQAVRRGDAVAAHAVWRGELLNGLYDDWVQDERERLNALYARLNPDTSRSSPLPLPDSGERPTMETATASGRTIQIPPTVTRFFGRESERVLLSTLLTEERWVSITGPGGIGKTRLAIEVAREWQAGDVWFVPFADLIASSGLEAHLAAALRLSLNPKQDPIKQISEFLGERPCLLVLDNCEQLVDEHFPLLLRTLLENCPEVRLLVTTRQPVGSEAERLFSLDTLPLPTTDNLEELAQTASIQLFLDRARRVRPDFGLTPRNMAACAALCRRLEGFPLALELVAAWSQGLSPSQMVARLEAGDTTLTTTRRRDVPERHRSLHNAFESSFRRLSPDLQRFFCQLSLFRGGWSLPAAEAVSERHDAAILLTELADASLITSQECENGALRYSCLESLRQFADERLTDSERRSSRLRHLALYEGLAAQYPAVEKVPEMEIWDEPAWTQLLSIEWDNILVALRTALSEGMPDAAVFLLQSLERFWALNGRREEACLWLEQCLSHPELGERARISAQMRLAHRGWEWKGLDFAEELMREALAAAETHGYERETADAYLKMGYINRYRDRFEEARQCLERAAERFARMNHRLQQSAALQAIGTLYTNQGIPEEARRYQNLAEDVLIGTPFLSQRMSVLYDRARVAFIKDQFDVAATMLLECIGIARRLEDGIMLGQAANLYGEAQRNLGNDEEGLTYLIYSIQVCARIRNRFGMHYPTWNLALMLSESQNYELAVPLLAYSLALWESLSSVPLTQSEAQEVADMRQGAEEDLGQDKTEFLWQRGKAMSMVDAAALAERAPLYKKK